MNGDPGRREGYPDNPFVGSRPLAFGEPLWGRAQEILDLKNLLSSERIVLLHSPSGAGTTSLVQAGLLPQLKQSFNLWGPTRCNLEPPEADAVDCQPVNRFVFSAIRGFEKEVPERLRRPLPVLAGQTLNEYFEQRPRRRSALPNVLAVFDQLEDLLIIDPLGLAVKQQFFSQLGELLRNPRVWGLFVLREHFLAALDPYARMVPTRFGIRYRIDLLDLDGACQAMVEAAREGGREFPAAVHLVNDLATTKVQQADGLFVEKRGLHVEPSLLQIVCRRLWSAIPTRSIDAENLARFGDVNEALEGYYAESVTQVCGGMMDCERTVRDWFGERLINAGGSRSLALRGGEESEGLANTIIAGLLNTYLVRSETRFGATWWELAQDRLIKPIQNNNAAWRAEHLSAMQKCAALWEDQGRRQEFLLRDGELDEAEGLPAGALVTTQVERLFLEESRQVRAAADRERHQERRIKRLRITAILLGVLAVLAMIFALH